MRSRIAVITLALLVTGLIAGCVSTPVRARYDSLANSAYPGDPNRDLVPYHARERDAQACHRDTDVQDQMDAAAAEVARRRATARGDTAYYLRDKLAGLDEPGTWDVFFQCMAAKGWKEERRPPATTPPPAVRPAAAPVPTVSPTSSRTAERLKELEGLRQQRLISEEEYQATRKRILEGL